MAYINNTFKPNSSSRASRQFTPALNNIRFTPSGTKGTSSKLNGSSLGMNAFKTPQVSEGWKNAFKGQSTSNIAGPVQTTNRQQPTSPASSGLMTTSMPSSSKMSTATPPSTNPQPEVGSTTIVGSSSGKNQTDMLKDKKKTDRVTGLVNPLSFGGIVGSLAERSKTSNDQKRLLRQLEQEAQANKAIGEQARSLSEDYGKQIAEVGRLGAGAVAGNLSTGSNLVGSGNAAIASQSASQRMQALGQAQTAALQGTGQQLTGTEQLTNALTSGIGAQTAQQQTGISGLTNAGNLAQPSATAYGQTVFDPVTGQYSGGNMDPQTQATSLAQKVMSGQMTYAQALASLGYAGTAGTNFLNNAITGAGGNPLQLEAQGGIQQANMTALGTAAASGQAGVLSSLPSMEAADTAAEGVKNTITTYLASNPQLNPAEFAAGNKLDQWIQGKQLSDPKYQTLANYLNEYTNTLAPILGVGGDPTNLKTEIAASFINAAASDQSIAEVLENMQSLSKGKIANLRSGAGGGGVVSSSQSYGTGGGGTWDW
jgi:hypothetical protein